MHEALLKSLSEHREIEASLDRLGGDFSRGQFDEAVLRKAWELVRAHHEREERDLLAGGRFAKLRGQHDEARQTAEGALSGETPDERLRLARRFHAIAQHNIIEEERDWFPYL